MRGVISVRAKCLDTYMPACPTAEIFCAIAKSTTLDSAMLQAIRSLGYDIRYVNDTRRL